MNAKEKVLERYPKARAMYSSDSPTVHWIDTGIAREVISGIDTHLRESDAWESAAALLDQEPKEVTLTELALLRSQAVSVQDRPVRLEQGTDGAFRVHVGGKMVSESMSVADMVAKLRELATPKPPEVPDMIPIMWPTRLVQLYIDGRSTTDVDVKELRELCREALAKARAAKPEPVSDPIQWHQSSDDDDNTYWVARSPVRERPPISDRLLWRLVQMLNLDRIQWVIECDSRLVGNLSVFAWDTIEEAKAAVQEAHDAIVREQKVGTE